MSTLPRDTGTVPEEVTHTMILFHGITRTLLMRSISHKLTLPGYPNCHAVARAYAKVFSHLEVVDGALVALTSKGLLPSFHSWLRFKKHTQFGVDVSPLGAVPYLTAPNLLFFDEHVLFQQVQLHDELLLGSDEAATQFYEFIGPIMRQLMS